MLVMMILIVIIIIKNKIDYFEYFSVTKNILFNNFTSKPTFTI